MLVPGRLHVAQELVDAANLVEDTRELLRVLHLAIEELGF